MIRYTMSAPQIDSNCVVQCHLCSEVEEGWQCALRRCRAEDHIEITAAGSQTPVACGMCQRSYKRPQMTQMPPARVTEAYPGAAWCK